MSLTVCLFIDRNVGGRLLQRELVEQGWSVVVHDDRFPQNAPDTDWLPEVAREGLLILTRDKNIRRRPDELQAMLESRARVLFVSFNGGRSSYLQALLKAEYAIERMLAEHDPPLAMMLYRDGGVRRMPLPPP